MGIPSSIDYQNDKRSGARGGTRTPILFQGLAPKASASTNFATLAEIFDGNFFMSIRMVGRQGLEP